MKQRDRHQGKEPASHAEKRAGDDESECDRKGGMAHSVARRGALSLSNAIYTARLDCEIACYTAKQLSDENGRRFHQARQATAGPELPA